MKRDKTDQPVRGQKAAPVFSAGARAPHGDSNLQHRAAVAADDFLEDATIRTLLESLAEGAVVVDNTGTIVLVNKQVERLFGYSREEIVGRSLNLLLPEKFHATHSEHVGEFFARPKIRPMGLGQELAARHKSGQEFPVEISLSHLETSGGGMAMAFITDTTLRHKAIQDLEARNEDLDAFAHTVAHDLRGSLAALIGYSELLTDREANLSGPQARESLAMICRLGRKMSDVLDELLLLASVRKEEVLAEPLDMLEIIREATFRLQPRITDSGAEITMAQTFPVALGYAPWVEEIWYNYLSNAVKYGGTPPRISLGGEITGDGYARFWIKDNGSGLSHSQQLQLFRPYASHTNYAAGKGLGLSIVGRIAEKLNGFVGVESEVGAGSIFSFKLPV